MKRALLALALALAAQSAAAQSNEPAPPTRREPGWLLHQLNPGNWSPPPLPGVVTDVLGRPLPLPEWMPGPISSEADRLRYQQLRQSQDARYQALTVGQYQLQTDQRLQALEAQRLQSPPPPAQQPPISSGRRLQPTRDQAPQSQAAAPIQPSAAPPSDPRTRGNLPL